jgi:hypothetical protein
MTPKITWATNRVVVTRDITPQECEWLRETIVAGTELWIGNDHYGVCTKDGSGIPVTDGVSEYVFEVPVDAVIGIIEK